MARFGQNPYGENLYRIVFADSRRHIVYGEWPNGERKASWVPLYPHLKGHWVLERWMTPQQFAGCTADQWNSNPALNTLGPYPDRGEYEISHDFDLVGPGEANLEKLISWIEAGQKRSFAENRAACQADYDREEAATSSEMQARIENCFPAFGGVPMAGYGGGRRTKTFEISRSAREAGLPVMRPTERGKHLSRSTLVSGDRLVTQP